MNRTEFFDKAKKYGHEKGKKMRTDGKKALRDELLAYYRSDKGQEEIMKGPPWHREASVETIVDAILEEVD